MAKPANVDFDLGVVREFDFSHGPVAGRAIAAGLSFTAECMKPERIDRFGCKRAPQKFDANRASAAFLAAPKDPIRRAHLRQRPLTTWTHKLTIHFLS
jgi:hypothetical protein